MKLENKKGPFVYPWLLRLGSGISLIDLYFIL